ncbi:MAG TPA: helix-turn-helix domain-containing protein [Capillimicrobium sp.]|nr:helix-turn-helix domain-containing protein [Capillimicrobium sp.]
MPPTLDQRVARLEERVDRLERAPAPAAPDAIDRSATFWALEGLKAQMPEPGGVLFTGAVTLADGHRAEWQQAFTTPQVLDGFGPQAASDLSALAHPVRLLILRELLEGERTTAQLAEHEQLGTSGQIYHHLRQLVAAGWLRTTTRGVYRVPTERVVPLLTILAAVTR